MKIKQETQEPCYKNVLFNHASIVFNIENSCRHFRNDGCMICTAAARQPRQYFCSAEMKELR